MTGDRPRATNWRTHHIDVLLGPRLQTLRGERGVSRADLARALRVSQPSLQHIESGENRISAAQLWQVCGVLGVPVQAMFEDLPNRIWRDRAESEAASPATAPASPSTGVEEGGTGFEGAPPRTAIARLAKAARPLTDAQIEVLVATARSLKR